MAKPLYNRVLLKLSGSALIGEAPYGIDHTVLFRIAREVFALQQMGVEVCIVIGGGNIYRGVSAATQGMDRSTADHMGMLATVINGLALQNAIISVGGDAKVLSAIEMPSVCDTYYKRKALQALQKRRVVIMAGGTGNPFFTTDTAAALRASELNCDAILKATKVDGVYCSDPMENPDAKFFPYMTYEDALFKDVRVMDATAITLARDNNLPLVVFSIKCEGGLNQVATGKGTFSVISNEEKPDIKAKKQ